MVLWINLLCHNLNIAECMIGCLLLECLVHLFYVPLCYNALDIFLTLLKTRARYTLAHQSGALQTS